MSDIDAVGAIYRRLKEHPDIFRYVSGEVYRESSPSGKWPLITISIEHIADTAVTPQDVQQFSVTIICESLDQQECRHIRNKVMEVLNRQRWTADNTRIVSIAHQGGGEGSLMQGGASLARNYYYQDLNFNVLARKAK